MQKNGSSWCLKKSLVFLLLLVLPFGQWVKLPLKIKTVNFYFFDLLVALLFLICLKEKIFFKKKVLKNPFFQPILAFVFWGIFSLILSLPFYQFKEIAVAFLYLARWTVYTVIFFVAYQSNKIFKEKFYYLIITGIFFSAFLGLMQYLFIPDVTALKGLNWDPHYFRIVGLFLDPGYTGMIYLLGLIMTVFILLKPNNSYSLAIKAFWWGAAGLLYLALALTYSRSSYLAFLTAMAIIALSQKSAKIFIFSFLLLFVTIVCLPRPGGEGVKLERKSTIFSRLGNWQSSIKIITNFPVFGVGFNNLRYVKRDYGLLSQEKWQVSHSGAGMDNSLLFVWVTTGILGLISYCWLGIKIFQQSLKNKNKLVLASLSALLVHSFFNNSLFYAWLMLYFWVILAISKNIKEYK